MSSSTASTPTQPDAVSLVLEINQLLLQHVLSLDQPQTQKLHTPDEVQGSKKECMQRLNANLAFLNACTDPTHRAKAKLALLSPPKHVPSVSEQYIRLAAMLARASPKQAVTSPNHYSEPSMAIYNNAKMAHARTSQSPRNGLMSPPAMMPGQVFQQQMQQQAHLQQQHPSAQAAQHQQHQSQNIPRHMVQSQVSSPMQGNQHQQQNLLRQQMQQRSHMQQQQLQQRSGQQAQQQQRQAQQQPVRSSQSPVATNGNGYNAQHVPSPQVSQQYVDPYRQEQLRSQQANKMASYPQSQTMVGNHQQQHVPMPQQMYMPHAGQQQLAMAGMPQQQLQQQQNMAQQMSFIPQQYQQPQGRMAYYPNNGQAYM